MISRYRKWRGEKLKLRAEIVWLLDEALDCFGQLGCRLRLHRYWTQERFRKNPLWHGGFPGRGRVPGVTEIRLSWRMTGQS